MNTLNSSYLNSIRNKPSYQFESHAWLGNELISGIDEVGRGCLAGPVIACCLVLKPFSYHDLLIDSKMLSENNLLIASSWIEKNSWYSVGIIHNKIIDSRNIYQATILAMKRAFYGLITHPELPKIPSLTLVDAIPLDLGFHKRASFSKGESKSVSVAAASIIAKKFRDDLMSGTLNTFFPNYAFKENKGYGTLTHQEFLKNKGNSLIHRKTYQSSLSQNIDVEDKNINLFI